MTTYAALLRGVNVGGNRKTPMAELREALEACRFGNVRTYLHSGNALVDSGDDPDTVAGRITAAVEDRFGHTVPVLVRSAADMDRIAAADPFAGRGLDPSRVTVTFLSGPAPALAVPEGQPEEAHVDGREVWVYYPSGQGTSTLDRSGFWKPAKGLDATTRNLRTVRKLRDLAHA